MRFGLSFSHLVLYFVTTCLSVTITIVHGASASSSGTATSLLRAREQRHAGGGLGEHQHGEQHSLLAQPEKGRGKGRMRSSRGAPPGGSREGPDAACPIPSVCADTSTGVVVLPATEETTQTALALEMKEDTEAEKSPPALAFCTPFPSVYIPCEDTRVVVLFGTKEGAAFVPGRTTTPVGGEAPFPQQQSTSSSWRFAVDVVEQPEGAACPAAEEGSAFPAAEEEAVCPATEEGAAFPAAEEGSAFPAAEEEAAFPAAEEEAVLPAAEEVEEAVCPATEEGAAFPATEETQTVFPAFVGLFSANGEEGIGVWSSARDCTTATPAPSENTKTLSSCFARTTFRSGDHGLRTANANVLRSSKFFLVVEEPLSGDTRHTAHTRLSAPIARRCGHHDAQGITSKTGRECRHCLAWWRARDKERDRATGSSLRVPISSQAELWNLSKAPHFAPPARFFVEGIQLDGRGAVFSPDEKFVLIPGKKFDHLWNFAWKNEDTDVLYNTVITVWDTETGAQKKSIDPRKLLLLSGTDPEHFEGPPGRLVNLEGAFARIGKDGRVVVSHNGGRRWKDQHTLAITISISPLT